MQEGFQDFADHYEKQKQVPEQFSPFQGVYVDYMVTNLTWDSAYVIFEAKAIFSATVDGKNQTFTPSKQSKLIPMDQWKSTSADDSQSHLLQGVRLSTQFINSLMWFASISNLTEYHGSARILDATINGTISYDPPVFSVEKDNLLSVVIGSGLILAECLHVNSTADQVPAILFKAEFSNLAGSGKIRIAATDNKTGKMFFFRKC